MQQNYNNSHPLLTTTKKKNQEKNAMEPDKSTIDFILNYSKALSVKKSKNLGYVENIMN